MKELNTFRKFLNENLDEISLRGLMNRDMTGEEIIDDPIKFQKLVNKVKGAIKMPLTRPEEISLRNHLEAEMKEFPDTDFSIPEEFKMLVKNALYNLGYEDDDLPDMNEEQVNEGMIKDFLLKTLLKTTDVVSPDTLKYVYSELVKQVGEDEANKAFQELGVDPKKYVTEGELNEQLTPDELRKEFYKGMQIMDSALAKGRGIIPQDKWDALYAAVTKIEDIAETL